MAMALGQVDTANGAPHPVSIVGVQASNGASLLYEGVAGVDVGDPNHWRPTGHVYVRNNSSSTVTVKSIALSYQGQVAPTPTGAVSGKTISPGQTEALVLPECRLFEFPVASLISIHVIVEDYNEALSTTYSLAHFSHPTPDGTYPFPMKVSEVEYDDTYLATGSNHGYGSNHAGSTRQRFAYDFHARRWTGSQWSTLRPDKDGTKPDDYLIWGQPVYAVASGKIVKGQRSIPDGAIDQDNSPGGNDLWIRADSDDQEAETIMLYAHLQQWSIPEELVPIENGPGPNVTKGQFLGLVGKSGTKKPHLHFHVQRGNGTFDSNGEPAGQGLPIRFSNFYQRSYTDGYNPDTDSWDWNHGTGTGIAENCLIVAEAADWVGPIKTTGLEPRGSHTRAKAER